MPCAGWGSPGGTPPVLQELPQDVDQQVGADGAVIEVIDVGPCGWRGITTPGNDGAGIDANVQEQRGHPAIAAAQERV